MNVCFCIDQNYSFHAFVAIHSLIKNNNGSKISIYLVVENRNLGIYELIKQHIELSGVSVFILEHSFNDNFQFKLSHHISLAAYTRLFLGRILPLDVKKVLYLDSDLIVLKNLNDLYDFDIEKAEIAAVPEFLGSEHNVRIGLKEDDVYFNSGVLLINLEKWRVQKIEQRFLNYIRLNYDRILWWDQDVINAVSKSIVKLEDKWNVTSLTLKKNSNYWNRAEIGILHFTGNKKPWNGSYGQFDIKYFECLLDLCDKSYFARKVYWNYLDVNLKNKTIPNILNYLLNLYIYVVVSRNLISAKEAMRLLAKRR
jgi:lipopolysaccharide biosynthesis glycosyltransferase